MYKLIDFFSRHKLFALSGLVVALAALYLVSSTNRGMAPPTAYPTPTIVPLNPNTLPGKLIEEQKAVIGQTTEDQLRNMPSFEKEEISPEGKSFIFTSPFASRVNSVSTNQVGIAIFERIILLDDEAPIKTTFSQIKTLLGSEEAIVEGSSFYGKAVNTYIYSSRGIAVLANPYTDYVYEVNVFQPMSTADYISRYADSSNTVDAQEGN